MILVGPTEASQSVRGSSIFGFNGSDELGSCNEPYQRLSHRTSNAVSQCFSGTRMHFDLTAKGSVSHY